MRSQKVYGLKDYTAVEIAVLKATYPNGWHKTHYASGKKLPYNGIFYTIKPRSNTNEKITDSN